MKVVTYEDVDPTGTRSVLVIEISNPMVAESAVTTRYGACTRTVEYR